MKLTVAELNIGFFPELAKYIDPGTKGNTQKKPSGRMAFDGK
jgi:hypothetical protein